MTGIPVTVQAGVRAHLRFWTDYGWCFRGWNYYVWHYCLIPWGLWVLILQDPYFITTAFTTDLYLLVTTPAWNTHKITHLSSLGPISGLHPAKPGMLMWSLMIMTSPTLYFSFRPPAALVRITVFTPSSLKIRMGAVTFEQGGDRHTIKCNTCSQCQHQHLNEMEVKCKWSGK